MSMVARAMMASMEGGGAMVEACVEGDDAEGEGGVEGDHGVENMPRCRRGGHEPV